MKAWPLRAISDILRALRALDVPLDELARLLNTWQDCGGSKSAAEPA